MSISFVPKTEQFDHQRTTLEQSWNAPGYALWWEPGLGKTKGFIDNGALLWCEGAVDGMFLLAPNGLHRNFISRELPKHCPDEMMDRGRSFFWRTDKADTKWFKNDAADFLRHDGPKMFGMSYDGIMTEPGRAFAKQFLTENRLLYGADESQRIKEPKTKRTERVVASGPFAPYRRIMTGTPVANAPWDVQSQVRFMLPDFWKSYGLDSPEAMRSAFGIWEKGIRRVPIGQAKWPKSGKLKVFRYGEEVPEDQRSHYIITGGQALLEFPKLTVGDTGRPQYRNLPQLREILKPIRSRVLKKDVFDLPPKINTTLEFEMTEKQKRAYVEMMENGFHITDEGKMCSTPLALTVLLRLQQIACGYLVADVVDNHEPEVLPFQPNPRLELLKELTADIEHQGIIWARFRSDIDQICALLTEQGRSFCRYDGKVNEDDRAAGEDRFHRGDAQWFVSNQAVGGEGLTLVEAETAVYYSNTFKLIERIQSSDRPHRYGLVHPINEIDIVAKGTVDEQIVDALIAKFDVAGEVTGDGLRQWLKRSTLL